MTARAISSWGWALFGTENGEWNAGQVLAVFGDVIAPGQSVDLADWVDTAEGRGFVSPWSLRIRWRSHGQRLDRGKFRDG